MRHLLSVVMRVVRRGDLRVLGCHKSLVNMVQGRCDMHLPKVDVDIFS